MFHGYLNTQSISQYAFSYSFIQVEYWFMLRANNIPMELNTSSHSSYTWHERPFKAAPLAVCFQHGNIKSSKDRVWRICHCDVRRREGMSACDLSCHCDDGSLWSAPLASYTLALIASCSGCGPLWTASQDESRLCPVCPSVVATAPALYLL